MQALRLSPTEMSERQRLEPWLEDKINSGKVRGLSWRNKDLQEFQVHISSKPHNEGP